MLHDGRDPFVRSLWQPRPVLDNRACAACRFCRAQEHGRRGNRGDVRSRASGRTPAYNASPHCLVSRALNSSGVEGIPRRVMGHYVSLGPIERLMTYASTPVPRGTPMHSFAGEREPFVPSIKAALRFVNLISVQVERLIEKNTIAPILWTWVCVIYTSNVW